MNPVFIGMGPISPLNLAVAAAGMLVFALGLHGVMQPSSLTALVGHIWSSTTGIGITLIIRISFGLLLIAAAPGTRFPNTLIVFGVLSLIKAASIPLLGRARQQNLARWWCHHPARYIRDWSLLVCAFGTFLIYAALSVHGSSTAGAAKSAHYLSSNEEHHDVRSAILVVPALMSKSFR